MTSTTPCYRHPRGVWLAVCDDCTAWYLAAARAHRDEVVALVATARPAARPASPAELTDVPSPVLGLAA
jgi:hypothetical protein